MCKLFISEKLEADLETELLRGASLGFLVRFMSSAIALLAIVSTVFGTLVGFAWIVMVFSGALNAEPSKGGLLRARALQARELAKSQKENGGLARNETAQDSEFFDAASGQRRALYRAFVSEFRSQVVRADLPLLGYGGMLRFRAGLDKLSTSLSKCRSFRQIRNENSSTAQNASRAVKFFAAELHPTEPRLVVTSMNQNQDESIFSPQETICLREGLEGASQPEWVSLQRPPTGSYQIILAVVSALAAQDEL